MIEIRVFYNKTAWIDALTDDFIRALAAVPLSRQPRLCLAGGKTPEPVYQVFSQLMVAGKAGPAPAILVPGDERVPTGQPSDLNETMLGRSFSSALASGAASLYSWFDAGSDRTAIDPPGAFNPGFIDYPALNMIRIMEAHLAQLASPSQLLFDLCYLGLGADGHTAGLFPGMPGLDQPGLCIQGLAPQPPRQRVSLGFPALISTYRTRFILTATGKEEALERLRDGDPDCPAARGVTGDTIAFVLA